MKPRKVWGETFGYQKRYRLVCWNWLRKTCKAPTYEQSSGEAESLSNVSIAKTSKTGALFCRARTASLSKMTVSDGSQATQLTRCHPGSLSHPVFLFLTQPHDDVQVPHYNGLTVAEVRALCEVKHKNSRAGPNRPPLRFLQQKSPGRDRVIWVKKLNDVCLTVTFCANRLDLQWSAARALQWTCWWTAPQSGAGSGWSAAHQPDRVDLRSSEFVRDKVCSTEPESDHVESNRGPCCLGLFWGTGML